MLSEQRVTGSQRRSCLMTAVLCALETFKLCMTRNFWLFVLASIAGGWLWSKLFEHHRQDSGCEVQCIPIGTRFHGIPNDVPYNGGPEGSCWCGHGDQYCLCTPSLSVDVVIEVFDHEAEPSKSLGIVVANRTVPPWGLALPGGFVEVGESAEDAAIREIEEETGMNLKHSQLQQSRLFSDPRRDPRRAGATQTFYARTNQRPPVSTGDETVNVHLVQWSDIGKLPFAFVDHRKIVAEVQSRFKLK